MLFCDNKCDNKTHEYERVAVSPSLVPLRPGDMVADQPGLLQQQAGQVLAALQQDLQTGPGHLTKGGAIIE